MGDLRKVQQTPTGTFFVCVPKSLGSEKWPKKRRFGEFGCDQRRQAFC